MPVQRELLTLPEHPSSISAFSGPRVSQSGVFLFLSTNVAASNYHCGIL